MECFDDVEKTCLMSSKCHSVELFIELKIHLPLISFLQVSIAAFREIKTPCGPRTPV